MKNYVITYSEIDLNNLFTGYLQIQGKTGIDALQKHYGKKFKRYGGRDCDVLLLQGVYSKEDNTIKTRGNMCGYKIV